MSESEKDETLAQAAERLRAAGPQPGPVLSELWDAAFEQGRLAALDEFSGRFCVCMK